MFSVEKTDPKNPSSETVNSKRKKTVRTFGFS